MTGKYDQNLPNMSISFLKKTRLTYIFVCTDLRTQSLHFLFVSNRDGSSLNLTFLLRKCSRCILTFVEKRRLSPTLIASRLPKIQKNVCSSQIFIFCAFDATAGNNRTFDFVFPPNLRPLPQATYL